MDIHALLVDEFLRIPHVNEWEAIQTAFRRAASAKPGHWLLPLRTCESAGGGLEQALPAILAVACSHTGIMLVDDMLDADPRGEHVRVGKAAAANMASALQSAALAVISRCEIGAESRLAGMECVNEMFLATAIGQDWDVNTIISDENAYWEIAHAKSSPFFGAAFQLGALAGGASVDLAVQVGKLGKVYGEMIQIHDDLHDTLARPAKPDWNADRSPLPILYARLVDHPLRDRFNELRPYAKSNSKVLEEAQEILIRCGAVSYCVYQLLGRHERVGEVLSSLPLQRREVLERVFADIVRPLHLLLQEAESAMAAHRADRV